MADDGKSIADAYRNLPSDAAPAPAATATPAVSDGTSIADAYRAADAAAKTQSQPILPGPAVPSAEQQTADTGLPLPQSPPPNLPQGGSNLANALDPAPNTTYASAPWMWMARDDKTGQLRFAMPSSIRDVLTGNVGVERTMDPETGKLSAGTPTAGANLLLQSAVPALRFSGDSPLLSPPSPTFGSRLAPTAPELTAAVSRAGETTPRMAMELEERLRASTPAPSGAQPTPATPAPTTTFLGNSWLRQAGDAGNGQYNMMQGGAAMSSAAQQALDAGHQVQLVADGGAKVVDITQVKNGVMYDAQGQQWGSAPIAFDGTGREGLRITQPAASTAPSGGPRATVAPQPTGPTPTTSAEALPIATGLLDKARASGADLTPDYTNKFIDKVTADATPAGPGTAAVAGPNDPVASMVQRLQALRDQPLNIQDVMGMDQELNARQRAAIKTDPDLARRIGNLQDSLRDQVDSATQANVGGGAEGWQAFQDGRAAYSQYKKMQAVEDMKERADGMTNPTSSYKTAVNNFVNGPKARGWTDEEKASLKDSAERGVAGNTLHFLGQRLMPLVAGGVGLSKYGAMGAVAATLGYHYAGDAMRNWGNALQTGRVNRTLQGLGSSVPNVLQQAPPP